MITYQDIELLENLKKNIYLPDYSKEAKDTLDSTIDNTHTMFVFTAPTLDEVLEKRNRLIEDLNIFINKHKEYTYDYHMNIGDTKSSVAFIIKNKKDINGITETSNTLN